MAEIPSPDPFVADNERARVDADFADHLKTYTAFLSLTKWAIIHMIILLVALYFFIIEHNIGLGFLFVFIAVCLMVYGIVRRPSVQKDLVNAASGRGDHSPAG